MKKLNLFVIVLTIFFSSRLFGQDMTPPSPVEAPVFSKMTGTWVSNPYEMLGSTMTDEVTQTMVLNGQFMRIEVRSIAVSGFIYEGMIMIAPASDGTLTGWAFDIFGGKSITTYTGTWKDNMVYVYGTSSWGTESRVISISDDVMIHNVIFKMKDASGKDMPEQKIEITYNKK